MSRYLTSILAWLWLLMMNSPSWGQASNLLPSSLQLSADIGRPLYYSWKTGRQYEFSSLIDFRRLMLVGDYGWGHIQRKGINKVTKVRSVCCNKGRYFRIGFNYNFIKHGTDHNAAFLGLRYAKSYFEDSLGDKLISVYSDEYENKFESVNTVPSKQAKLQARWWEIVAGVQVKIWEWLYTGCTIRYKFGKKISKITSHLPFDIIGWGLNEEDAWGLNYYITLRIPLQKATIATPIPKQ